MVKAATVYKVNQLGDNLVFLPGIQHLVRSGILRRVHLWTTPTAAPLYENLGPSLQLEVIPREDFYPAWKFPVRLASLAKKSRKHHPEAALVAEDMVNTAYFLSIASGARIRLGIRPRHLKIPFAINQIVPLNPTDSAALKSWKLCGALAKACLPGASWAPLPPPPDLTHLQRETGPLFDVLIHPGASRAYQRWPLSQFAALALLLAKTLRVGWIRAFDPLPEDPNIQIIEPKTLGNLVSALSRTRIFVGNNSGPMNVASALGIPSVILMGPSARNWDPYWFSERFRILRDETLPCIACDPSGGPIREVCTNLTDPMACMNAWSVERVFAAVREWLEKWPTPARP